MDLDDVVPKILFKAALHARKISQRGNQKCNRWERVSHFIVDLRRMFHDAEARGEISVSVRRNIQHPICNKTNWRDILELESHAKINRNWVAQANVLRLSLDDQVAAIEGDLEGLREDLASFAGLMECATKINEKGDDLENRLEALFAD